MGSDGKVRHMRSLDEELVPLSQQEYREGQSIFIVEGKHEGLYASIVKLRNEQVLARLKDSEREVMLPKSSVIRGDDTQGIQEKIRQIKDREREIELARDYEKQQAKKRKATEIEGDSKSSSSKHSKTSSSSSSSGSAPQRTWLFPNLIVRIVSKTFRNGECYLQKAQIVDVLSPKTCSVKLVDNQRVGVLEGNSYLLRYC